MIKIRIVRLNDPKGFKGTNVRPVIPIIDYMDKIIEAFESLRDREYARDERFKVAYIRAIEAIEQLGKPIISVNDTNGT